MMSEFEDLVLEYEGGFPGSGPNWAAYEKMKARGRYLEEENARLREAARWIPVSERLPEPLIPVEVVMDGMVTNLMLSPDKETWMNVAGWPYSASSITHWRALPEPPEVK